MPPYCITDEELTRAYAGLIEGLDTLASGDFERAIDDVPGDAAAVASRRWRGWRGGARLAKAARSPPSA